MNFEGISTEVRVLSPDLLLAMRQAGRLEIYEVDKLRFEAGGEAAASNDVIERIILKMPISEIVLAPGRDGYTVINGGFEVFSILQFVAQRFKLRPGEKSLIGPQFDGVYFQDLPDVTRKAFMNASIATYMVMAEPSVSAADVASYVSAIQRRGL